MMPIKKIFKRRYYIYNDPNGVEVRIPRWYQWMACYSMLFALAYGIGLGLIIASLL